MKQSEKKEMGFLKRIIVNIVEFMLRRITINSILFLLTSFAIKDLAAYSLRDSEFLIEYGDKLISRGGFKEHLGHILKILFSSNDLTVFILTCSLLFLFLVIKLVELSKKNREKLAIAGVVFLSIYSLVLIFYLRDINPNKQVEEVTVENSVLEKINLELSKYRLDTIETKLDHDYIEFLSNTDLPLLKQKTESDLNTILKYLLLTNSISFNSSDSVLELIERASNNSESNIINPEQAKRMVNILTFLKSGNEIVSKETKEDIHILMNDFYLYTENQSK